MTARIAVVGGGLAGITAALACADAGCDVVLLEARPRLGGLTYSFQRDGRWVDNGQHVFLRCCTAYRQLLDRLGVTDLVGLQPRLDIPVLAPGLERPARLRRGRLPAPLHLLPALLRYGLLPPADRLRVARAALGLRRLDPRDPAVDAQAFGAWLAAHGQRPAAVDALWDLVGVATLNLPAADASLANAAMVFQEGLLGEAGAGDIGWSLVPLQRLHGEAAQGALGRAGCDVRLRAPVRTLERVGSEWRVGVDDERLAVDAVVLAVPPADAERLLPAGAVCLPDGWAAALGSSPIVNVHVRYARRVLEWPVAAAVGGGVQWVFDRSDEQDAPGQYVVASFSAADELVELPVSRIRERVEPALAAVLPLARTAEVLEMFVTRERSATFRAAPGSARLRPASATALPGLALAGAWTATGWPATMEGAVRSGAAAAGAILPDLAAADRAGAVPRPAPVAGSAA